MAGRRWRQLVGLSRPVMMAWSCLAIDDRRPDRYRPSAPGTSSCRPVRVLLWASGFVDYQARHPFRRALHLSALSLRHRDGADGRVGARHRRAWPRTWRLTGHIAVVGLFLQAIYLGGVYTAIARGIPAGISALIVGVQPIIIAAVVGPLLGERVRARQWLGACSRLPRHRACALEQAVARHRPARGRGLERRRADRHHRGDALPEEVLQPDGLAQRRRHPVWRGGCRDLCDDADHGRDWRHRVVATTSSSPTPGSSSCCRSAPSACSAG